MVVAGKDLQNTGFWPRAREVNQKNATPAAPGPRGVRSSVARGLRALAGGRTR